MALSISAKSGVMLVLFHTKEFPSMHTMSMRFTHRLIICPNEKQNHVPLFFLVACTRLYDPLCPSVCWSVHRPYFAFLVLFWSYFSCPTAWLVYFFTAPAHPHATCITVWPCFFSRVHATLWPALSVGRSVRQSVTLCFLALSIVIWGHFKSF